jgi:predicted GIY-YIG superfamily endonuclease
VYFVYIIRTLDDTLYIGVSGRLGQRVGSHKSGKEAEWIKAHRIGSFTPLHRFEEEAILSLI